MWPYTLKSAQSQVIFCLTGHTPDKQQMPQLPKGYHLFSLGNKALLHHWLLTGRCLTILGILKYSSLSPGFLSGRMEPQPDLAAVAGAPMGCSIVHAGHRLRMSFICDG